MLLSLQMAFTCSKKPLRPFATSRKSNQLLTVNAPATIIPPDTVVALNIER
jgi:hypothetical protein